MEEKYEPYNEEKSIKFTPNGVKPVYSRDGRNHEIPAFAVQVATTTILLQSLIIPLGSSHPKLRNSSHNRALGIVEYVYKRRGIVLPSYVDMYDEDEGWE